MRLFLLVSFLSFWGKNSKRLTRFGHRYVTFAQALIASRALRKLTNA